MKHLWPGLWQDLIANRIASATLIPRPIRPAILGLAGFRVDRATIEPHVYWFGSGPVSIGNRAYINRRATINHSAAVTIGADVAIGPECQILTASHAIGTAERRCAEAFIAPVVIEDGAWIGARTIILPGVTIGAGSVVGAGSIVTESLEPNGTYIGAPARRVRDLDESAITR